MNCIRCEQSVGGDFPWSQTPDGPMHNTCAAATKPQTAEPIAVQIAGQDRVVRVKPATSCVTMGCAVICVCLFLAMIFGAIGQSCK